MKLIEKIKNKWCKRKVTVSFKDNYINCGLPVVGLWCDNVKLNFLVDSGSTINAINEEAVKYLHYTDTDLTAEVAHAGGISSGKFIKLTLNDTKNIVEDNFMVINLSEQFATISQKDHVLLHGIVGCRFLETIEGKLDFKKFELTY